MKKSVRVSYEKRGIVNPTCFESPPDASVLTGKSINLLPRTLFIRTISMRTARLEFGVKILQKLRRIGKLEHFRNESF